MSSSKRCSECGKAIPADSPGGFCAECLLRLGLGTAGEPAVEAAVDQPPKTGEDAPEGPGPDSQRPNGNPAVIVSPSQKPGDRIGHYRLLQEIGQGGCGVVYMAEQEEPVRRKVALKVLKLGMDTRQVVARFEAERQALALMDHPNIARVLDAGATGTGRPFFAMELVGGIKITDFCDRHNLNTKQRLDLFIQVCGAIQHAHQKGIIHRDIKPSNVLVATQDGLPVPKVIDFGIAKATQGRLTDQTLFTAFEQFIGTPAYMSPEQAELGGLDVDTRSDIYSLGVLLYELLTGATPFDTKRLLHAGLDEMRRTIREKEPSRPSTRLSTMGKNEVTIAAQHRQSEAPKLIQLLRGDLDWIVMKCLEKDRARRYETVNGLARDIERYLSQEPVLARPPSTVYRVHKFIRRNRVTAAAATAVATVLVVGVAVSTWETLNARRAEREQTRLRYEADAARKDATEKLWRAYLAEVRALRLSGQSGRYFNSLAALREAAAIRPSPELRNEAIACSVLADLQPTNKKDFAKGRQKVVADVTLEKYAVTDSGTVSIRRVSDDSELARLPALGTASTGVGSFSTDGRWFAEFYRDSRWRVWDWARSAFVVDAPGTPEGGIAFSAQPARIGISDSTNIFVYDLISGDEVSRISLRGLASSNAPGWFRFDPSGQRLAVFVLEEGTNVLILDILSGQKLVILPHTDDVYEVAWHPDGRHLATCSADGFVQFWDSVTGRLLRKWQTESTVTLAFNHLGNLLASSGWDGKTRLWDFPSGRHSVCIHKSGHIVGFAPDDQGLVLSTWDATELEFFGISAGLGLRTLHEELENHSTPGGQVVFSPSGRLVAGTTLQGIRLWDAQAAREVAVLDSRSEVRGLIGFDAAERNLVVTGPAGLHHWPIPSNQGSPGPAILVNAECADPEAGRVGVLSADGKVAAIVGNSRCQIFRTDSFAKLAETGIQPGMRFVALSPDGTLLASGAWKRNGVKVWNAQTGELVKEMLSDGPPNSTSVVFSPDGRQLVTSTIDEYCFWKVGDWSLARRIPQQPGNDFVATMTFSCDGKVFAGTHTRNIVRLYDAATGNVLADLEAPHSEGITSLSFNHDGTQLAACESRTALRIWDLRRIREHLAWMGLDWDPLLYPTQPPSYAAAPKSPGGGL